MSVRHHTNLALAIVGDHFGPVCRQVVHSLVHHGSMTLSDLIKFTQLPFPLLRNSLISLVQHDIVLCDFDQFDGDRPTFYTFQKNHVINRLRFPRYLEVVGKRVGFLPRLMLFEVMKDGKITIDECLRRVQNNADIIATREGIECPSLSFESLRSNFVDLVMLGGLKKVASTVRTDNSSTKQPTVQETVIVDEKVKAKAKSRRSTRIAPNTAASSRASALASSTKINEHRLAAAGGLVTQDFDNLDSIGAETETGLLSLVSAPVGDKRKADELAIVAVAPKRKRQRKGDTVTQEDFDAIALEFGVSETSLAISRARDASIAVDGVFMVDCASLDKVLLSQHAEDLLCSRLGAKLMHQVALRSMLRDTVVMGSSSCSLSDIVASIGRLQSENDPLAIQVKSIDREQVRFFLESACGLVPEFLDKTEKKDNHHSSSGGVNASRNITAYKLNLKAILNALQSRLISSAVRARTGTSGVRVYNFLKSIAFSSQFASGKVEDKIVSEKCLLPPRTTRSTLLTLVNNGLVQTQDLSKVAQSTSSNGVRGLVFFVRESEAKLKLEESILKSILNLRARLAHENKRLMVVMRRGGVREGEHLEMRMLAEDILDLNVSVLDDALLILQVD